MSRDYAEDLMGKFLGFGAGHAMCAYLGILRGHSYIHEAIADPLLRPMIQRAIQTSRRSLLSVDVATGADVVKSIEWIVTRYGNADLGDPLTRVARDPIRKLSPDGPLVGAAHLVLRTTGRERLRARHRERAGLPQRRRRPVARAPGDARPRRDRVRPRGGVRAGGRRSASPRGDADLPDAHGAPTGVAGRRTPRSSPPSQSAPARGGRRGWADQHHGGGDGEGWPPYGPRMATLTRVHETTASPRPPLGVARRRYGEGAVRALLACSPPPSPSPSPSASSSLLGRPSPSSPMWAWASSSSGASGPLFSEPRFGRPALLSGTLLITGIAVAVAIPLGLGSAIYLSEYAPDRVRRVLKPALELLAGVPTIVFGYFALTFFTPVVLRDLLNVQVEVFNALSAGIVMGFMVLPTIASVAEDALSAVPAALRQGAFGLGASKLQTSLRVVLPAALSGVVAAIVLGVSRAVETMIVLVAAGQVADLSLDPGDPRDDELHRRHGQGRRAHRVGRLRGDLRGGHRALRDHLLMNAVSIRFVRRYREVYE